MQHNRMSSAHQQTQAERRKQLIAKFRQAFPPTVSIFSRVISSVKKVSSLLIDNLSKVSKYFMKQRQTLPVDNRIQERNQLQEQRQSLAQSHGRVINFAGFKSEEGAEENKQAQLRLIRLSNNQISPIEIKPRGMNSLSEQEKKVGQNKYKINWHQLQNYKINTKLTRPKPQYRDDSRLIQNILNYSPSVTRHFQEIYNQAMLDCAEISQAGRKSNQLPRKPQKESLYQSHQDYLKSLGIDSYTNGIKGNHKKIVDMWKRKRQIVQSRRPRKKVHVEQDKPPIYCVEKVMEVFQKQSEQFFKERRQRQQQEARIKREQERLQELERLERQRQAEQENRLRQQRQAQERARKEAQQRQRLNVIQVSANQGQNSLNSHLEVIPQNNQPQNEASQRSIPRVQENVYRSQSLVEPNIPLFSPKKQKQQLNQPFSTPKKNVKQQQKSSNSIENQSVQNKSGIKQNPFIKQNVSPLKFDDVVKLNPVSIFPSVPPQAAPTIGSTFFSKNQKQCIPNIFTPAQSLKAPQQPQSVFFQNLIPSNPYVSAAVGQPQQLQSTQQAPFFAVTPVHSQLSHSSSDRANIFSAPGSYNISTVNNDLQVRSEQIQSNKPFGSLLAGNAEASRMFSRNLFAPNIQETKSLFGPSNTQANPKQTTSRGRKGKNQVRIN